MNLAEPAGRVSPAIADDINSAAKGTQNPDLDNYIVEPADNMNELDNHDVSMTRVVEYPAVARIVDENVQSSHPGNESMGLSVDRLKQGPTGIVFEGAAGVCKGMEMHGVRRVTLALSRFLPAIYDQRDFVSYGEILRYVVVKDNILFVYAEKTDPNYLYMIPLESLKAVKEDPNHPHERSVTISPGYGTGNNRQDENIVNVLLLEARNRLVYQIAFNISQDKDIADTFVGVVQNINISQKSVDKIRK